MIFTLSLFKSMQTFPFFLLSAILFPPLPVSFLLLRFLARLITWTRCSTMITDENSFYSNDFTHFSLHFWEFYVWFVCIGKNNNNKYYVGRLWTDSGFAETLFFLSFFKFVFGNNSCNLVFKGRCVQRKCVQFNEHRTFIWYLLRCIMASYGWLKCLGYKMLKN